LAVFCAQKDYSIVACGRSSHGDFRRIRHIQTRLRSSGVARPELAGTSIEQYAPTKSTTCSPVLRPHILEPLSSPRSNRPGRHSHPGAIRLVNKSAFYQLFQRNVWQSIGVPQRETPFTRAASDGAKVYGTGLRSTIANRTFIRSFRKSSSTMKARAGIDCTP